MGEQAQRARRAFGAMSHAEAVQVVYVEERDRLQRREERLPSGRGPHRLTCKACHRFVRSISAPCPCGWDPAVGWGA